MHPATLADLPAPRDKTGWPWTEEPPQLPDTMPDGQPWPKISIVTPSYNQGQFLEETIRSVLLQGYPNLEYIVMDGGSTDSSVEIIKKYEPWLSYWESEPDRGQSHAINKGFARAGGDIGAWINSDDLYHPHTFSTIGKTLADKHLALLVGNSVITNGPCLLEGKVDSRKPAYDEMLYEGRTFPQPSVFWTIDLWQEIIPLREELNYAMDFDLWLRMGRTASTIIFCEEQLSYARTHPGQKTYFMDAHKQECDLQQKGYSVLIETRAIRLHPLRWLFNSYSRRLAMALHKRKWTLLRSSRLQKKVLKLYLDCTFQRIGLR